MKVDLKNPVYVVAYAAVVSTLFTAAIVGMGVLTAGIVRRNEQLLMDRALIEILFGADVREGLSDEDLSGMVRRRVRRETVTDPRTGSVIEFFVGYDRDLPADAVPDGRGLVGYAFPISGVGFWARIDGLLAVTPDLNTVKGMYILKHSETPGLGGRCTEEEFRRPFVGLDISPPIEAGGKFLFIGGGTFSSPEPGKARRRVDAITGATGTSAALERFINESIRQFRRAMKAAGRVD